ncbi:MAG: hypothetical protein LC746_14845 [Acidobacteria bacterium]|nr:hypothetical protein [Acidobacteriota bacterium]
MAETETNSSKIPVERDTLEAVRRTLQRVKRESAPGERVREQNRRDADRHVGEIDKLLRQATDASGLSKVDFEGVFVEGFYDDVDVQNGAAG